MRQEQGIEALVSDYDGQLTVKALSELLLEDLKSCSCLISGKAENEQAVLLAELNIISDSLFYDMFDQRIEFTVAGEILSDQFVPLTYRVQGDTYSFHGRCSTIPQVCGVDLYLSASYTGKKTDSVHQNFSVSVKKLFKTYKGDGNK